MGYAKPTQARLIDQRARRRATQDLIEKYRDEFDALYWQHRNQATEEADAIARKAAEDEHLAEHGDEPARLKTGARKPGETPLDRLDVARCRFCIGYHDRGHACRSCGAVPNHALTIPDDGELDEIAIERAMRGDTVRLTTSEREEAARRMAAKGATQAQILNALRMSKGRLDKILGSAS